MQPRPTETPLEEDEPSGGVELVPAGTASVDLQPATPLPTPPAPPSFDAAAANTALSSVDLTACGPARGYARVTVSFSPDGSASGVSFTLPYGSSSDARICADATLRAVRIPAFSGSSPISVHRAIYVS